MGLRDDLLRMPLEQRFTYDPANAGSSSISRAMWSATQQDVERIRRIVESMLAPLGHKVHAIVNYENFQIFPDIVDEYSAMVGDLVATASIAAPPATRPAASCAPSSATR